MSAIAVAKEVNKILKLDPPIVLDNEKTALEELKEVAPEMKAADFKKGGLTPAAAKFLLENVELSKATKAEAEKLAKGAGPVKKSGKKQAEESPDTSSDKAAGNKKTGKKPAAKKKESVALGKVIEEMVAAGKSSKEIDKEGMRVFSERGKIDEKGEEWCKSRIEIYITCAKRKLGLVGPRASKEKKAPTKEKAPAKKSAAKKKKAADKEEGEE